MAIYHYTAKIIGRSSGRNATSASAYRAGVAIVDRRTGMDFDFSKKSGCDYSEILAPKNSPEWVHDRSELWNRVEEKENRKDAQVCREIEFSLPRELTHEQMKALALGYVQEQFVQLGMVADVAFHKLDTRNPHCHVMLTMRDIGPNGFGNKVRAWNDRALLEPWREQWAVHANKALAQAGHSDRIDHRTLIEQAHDAAQKGDMAKARDLDRLPMFHEGHGPRAQFIHADNIGRMGENWKKKEEWDAITAQAYAEARLMAPSSDARPQQPTTKELTHESQRRTTTGRWARTARADGRPASRPDERPLTERSINAQRVRSYRNGPKPVLALSGSDNPSIVLPRQGAKRSRGAVRGDEPRHTSDSEPLHLSSGIRKTTLHTLGRTPAPALSNSPAQPKAGRIPLTGKAAQSAVLAVGRATTSQSLSGVDQYGRERMQLDDEALRLYKQAVDEIRRRVTASNETVLQLARDDMAMREKMARGENLNARTWNRQDNRAREAQQWLNDNAKTEAKRMTMRDRTHSAVALAQIDFDSWTRNNPEPPRHFWNNKNAWLEWDRARREARQVLDTAQEQHTVAKALTELVAVRQLEKERADKIRERQRAIQNRQAIDLLPSERYQLAEEERLKFPERPNGQTDDESVQDMVARRQTKQKREFDLPTAPRPKGMG